MTAPALPIRNRHATESIGIATLATSSSAASAADPDLPGRTRPVSGPLSTVASTGNAWTDGLQPAALIVGLLFIVFTVYNWLAFPPGVRGPVCIHDLGL